MGGCASHAQANTEHCAQLSDISSVRSVGALLPLQRMYRAASAERSTDLAVLSQIASGSFVPVGIDLNCPVPYRVVVTT